MDTKRLTEIENKLKELEAEKERLLKEIEEDNNKEKAEDAKAVDETYRTLIKALELANKAYDKFESRYTAYANKYNEMLDYESASYCFYL